MKERGILFDGPRVREILDGTKTRTCRIIKDVPDWVTSFGKSCFTPISPNGQYLAFSGRGSHPKYGPSENFYKCPFGIVGDRLWVRETFSHWEGDLIYRADGFIRGFNSGWDRVEPDVFNEVTNLKMWKPSIHMPRWASRINLEITDIKIQPLHEVGDPAFWGEKVWVQNPWMWVIEFRRVP